MNGNEYIVIIEKSIGHLYCGPYKYLKLLSMFDYNDKEKIYAVKTKVAEKLLHSDLNQSSFMEIIKREKIKGYTNDKDIIFYNLKRRINNAILSEAIKFYLNNKSEGETIPFDVLNYKILIKRI